MSSPTMPSGRGTPPVRSTMAESVVLFTSRICPGAGSASIGTTSSPVEMTATTGRAKTSNSAEPRAASRPSSCGRSRVPRVSSVSPLPTSSAGPMRFCCGATARVTSIVDSSIGSVCSTITTASAPGGTMPPVRIRAACPGFTPTSALLPISTSPTTVKSAGAESDAPKVDDAQTA